MHAAAYSTAAHGLDGTDQLALRQAPAAPVAKAGSASNSLFMKLMLRNRSQSGAAGGPAPALEATTSGRCGAA